MEKVDVYDPMTNNYRKVINLYYTCSGVSLGENIEDLNVSQDQGTTSINLSSISGKEEGKRPLITIRYRSKKVDQYATIIRWDRHIPKLQYQDFNLFQEVTKSKEMKWASTPTQDESKTLPIILVGLSNSEILPFFLFIA